ncbi:hypothetical protein BDV23DRAFT_188133 [Aspergillus alliaceus]|uniref:Uncharacterized protein n=1 Tax=Petromyces alliaceus TaxID=209559 RepID=A0A5N7BUN9_PETAA|nr:hypothetical protein BDV23DRAFT_188133 [Aspergillus alliaceus]
MAGAAMAAPVRENSLQERGAGAVLDKVEVMEQGHIELNDRVVERGVAVLPEDRIAARGAIAAPEDGIVERGAVAAPEDGSTERGALVESKVVVVAG